MTKYICFSFISISDDFREAREYELSLRQPPPVYNDRRRRQRPLPQVPCKKRLRQNDRNLVNKFGSKLFSQLMVFCRTIFFMFISNGCKAAPNLTK